MWKFCEDISENFALSQSILFKAYGGIIQETGHKTRGHLALTENDRQMAKHKANNLLYGEILPRGLNKVRSTFAI